MTIVHVIDSLAIGGAEMMVVSLCQEHQAQGHQLEVHCLEEGGRLSDVLKGAGIPVVVHSPRPRIKLLQTLFRAFRRSQPDVVHCHNTSATVLSAPVARLAGVRTVISTRHGLLNRSRERGDYRFWLAARWCYRVVVVCEAARLSALINAGTQAHKIVAIRNGVSSANLPASNIYPPGLKLITVGRLVPEKDQITLLRAIHLACKQVSGLLLRVVGDGPLRQALTSLSVELGLEDNVEFLGDRDDVAHCLQWADIFVLSSRTEGLPLALLEAMSVGLPSIVTNVGGMAEVIHLSGGGLLVEAGDPASLAQAVVDLAGRGNGLMELGRRAQQCYRAFFTTRVMAEAYLQLYKRHIA